MFGPEEFKTRLLGIRINPKFPLSICDEEELIGCSEEEILEIEQSAGFTLPKAYKDFMRIAGKKSGEFLSDCQIHYPKVIRTNQNAKERIGKYFTFPDPCFVFSSYQGDISFFCNEGNDPPVYEPVSIPNGTTYKQVAPSFWSCIESALRGYSPNSITRILPLETPLNESSLNPEARQMPSPPKKPWYSALSRDLFIAAFAVAAIALHLVLRYALNIEGTLYKIAYADLPLIAALLIGGLPLVVDLLKKIAKLDFSSDILAGISIVTAVLLGEYLAGTLVVLMLSGGQALESYAVRKASSALEALAQRMPSIAHRQAASGVEDVPLADVAIGDLLIVFPHETCPVDAVVVEGHSTMDESYLTGEPYVLSKVVGSQVLSGAINGVGALTIRAEQTATDSRYAKIMQVMRESEQRRPSLRRLGDQLGAYYTPLAVAIAVVAWIASGDPTRFLAVMVVATPCPLLIGIPVAIIGSVSLAARRAIIIKDPAVLEKIDTCRTAIFDKTGTLTYGQPKLAAVLPREGLTDKQALAAIASLEQYSRHPLAAATLAAAKEQKLPLANCTDVSERPGEGLRGHVAGQEVQVTSRKKLLAQSPDAAALLPEQTGGLECVLLLDGKYAATFQYRDKPRAEGKAFIKHLRPHHGFKRVMIVSGDRASEVDYLAKQVGITEVYASQSPEQKLALVRAETNKAPTVYMGDGINDAPALTAATVGIAFGQASDVTAEAAGAVILETSLERVDELLHIGRRMRTIALQTAIGGMVLSLGGMLLAATGHLPPIAGAITQEVIDVLAVLNALRASFAPRVLTDY